MLDRLEGTHRLAELLALEAVVHGEVDHALGQAEQLRGTTQGTAVHGRRPEFTALFGGSHAGGGAGRPLDPEQLAARVHRFVAHEIRLLARHRVHLIAMGQQQEPGHMGIGYQRVARLAHGETRLAFGHAGQPFALQVELLATQSGEERHADQHGVHQGFGQGGVAAFLGQQDEVQLVHVQAAETFRHRDGGEAQFGELGPEFIAAAALGLPELADALGCHFVGEEGTHVALEQQLVVAEGEVHGAPVMRAACQAFARR
ncbi:hypothetical protein FQZ97_893470 [compost metagenome]